MYVPLWVWIASAVGVLAVLVFDFYSHVKTPHEPTLKEAGIWSAVYIIGALIFGVGVWLVWDHQHGLEYLTGYLKSKGKAASGSSMMFFKLACWAAMSVCTCDLSAPAVCAVTRSAFICFRMVDTLVIALVAVLTTEEPRFSALVTADRAEVSDFMLVEIDQ